MPNKKILVIAELIACLILLTLMFIGIRGCVNAKKESSKKQNKCSEEGKVTQLTCPAGQTGRIFHLCKDGKEQETFNDCASSCGKATFTDLAPLIKAKCISCHTGFDSIETAKVKINEMIRRVNLGDSDSSRMPKAPNKPLEAAEKQLFSDWKSQGELAACPDDGAANPPINLNQMEEAMLADINSLTHGNQAETRWIVVTHKSNEGSTKAELAKYVAAINKGVNSISTGRNIILTQPIDKWGTIYRFNLNDIKLTFAAWDLIEAGDPVNFVSNTNIGDLLKTLTNSQKPWMSADAFLESATKAQVYYTILKIPSDLATFLTNVGVNENVQFDNFQALQVGFNNSPISLNKNRLIVRFDENNGSLWQTFDSDGNNKAAQNLFQFPLIKSASGNANYLFAASEIIFGLANGAHGYALFDALGKRLDAAALNIVAQNVHPPADPTIKNSKSCFRCHNGGFIPRKDEVKASVDRNAAQFDLRDVDLVDELYRDPARSFDDDNNQYEQAMAKMGIAITDQDPVSIALDNLEERTLSAKAVASYLFITEQEFLDGLVRSAEAQQQVGTLLTGGSITFDQFIKSLPVIYRDLRIGEQPL